MTELDVTEIMALIPNRYPILYVDRVTTLVPDEHLVALKNVSMNESFFQGHFPGNPVMPGVLLIEAMAQATSILILASPKFQGKTAYMTGVDQAKFKHKVQPGDQLIFDVTFDRLRNQMGRAKVTAWVGDQLAVSAYLMFVVSEDRQQA